jgi:acetyl-CoA carboxylase biotin carboxylase subunit
MKKILIANRSEIAVRVIQSAKSLGYETVAIFSEADRNSLHVRLADEAVSVGLAPSSESYLNGDKIIAICKELQVDAIHPGYGFLSENAAFAKKVEENGITFIGPSPAAMEIMGSKLAAKAAVAKYNVPLVPGTDEAISDILAAKRKAQEIGFPVLIKASAGGGGKGMRIVLNEGEFEEQMDRAVSEAQSSFGDGSVFIERYIKASRHIEIQVLGDHFGNVVHLNERECSIQRRHQKVIEEAPSAIVTAEMRAALGEAAINVAKACSYVGAGTVEFIMDENNDFFFLEMNTRLQVEHPVTEMITGIDLVKEQIHIAQKKPISFTQQEVGINGHAIELRVYAEDTENNFMPDIGTLVKYQLPEGDGIRVDNGYTEGMTIPIYYDSMLAKLIVHAKTRQEAIERMKLAIEHFVIEGIKTTLPIGKFAMNHPAFITGNFNTKFIEDYFSVQKNHDSKELIAALMAVKIYHNRHDQFQIKEEGNLHQVSNWNLRKE